MTAVPHELETERIGETLEGPQPFLGMVVRRYGIREEAYRRSRQE